MRKFLAVVMPIALVVEWRRNAGTAVDPKWLENPMVVAISEDEAMTRPYYFSAPAWEQVVPLIWESLRNDLGVKDLGNVDLSIWTDALEPMDRERMGLSGACNTHRLKLVVDTYNKPA